MCARKKHVARGVAFERSLAGARGVAAFVHLLAAELDTAAALPAVTRLSSCIERRAAAGRSAPWCPLSAAPLVVVPPLITHYCRGTAAAGVWLMRAAVDAEASRGPLNINYPTTTSTTKTSTQEHSQPASVRVFPSAFRGQHSTLVHGRQPRVESWTKKLQHPFRHAQHGAQHPSSSLICIARSLSPKLDRRHRPDHTFS